jgi:hypothetical protein
MTLNELRLSGERLREEWYLPLETRELGRDVGRELERDECRDVGLEDDGVTPSSLPGVSELELTLTGLLAREGELPVASRNEVFPPGEATRLKLAADARSGLDLLPLPRVMDVSGETPLSRLVSNN